MTRMLKNAIALLLLPFLVASCGLMRGKSDFDKVGEARPLEIPPDLDQPNTEGSLEVPDRPTGGGVSRSAGTSSPASGASASAEARAVIEMRSGVPALVVRDSLDSVYRRTGIALERSGIEVESSDAGSHRYAVRYMDYSRTERKQGFFKKMVRLGRKPKAKPATFDLSFESSGAGDTVIMVSKDGSNQSGRSADEILSVLRERLG